MSFLINYQKLEIGVALQNDNHPMHMYAKEVTNGMKELRDRYGKVIKFVRPGYPKKCKGTDSRGRETEYNEPDTPALFPLEKRFIHPERGAEIWSCCLQMPIPQPGGLFSIGKKRSVSIKEFRIVDLDKEPDLAYYLYYIAGFGVNEKDGRLKVEDRNKEIREKASKKMRDVERQTAIWQMLVPGDVETLRTVASAYGVSDVDKKLPEAIGFELETRLEENDKKKNKNPMLKGTREFLEEMKVTDNVRLRSLLMRLMDQKKIEYRPDGRFWLGTKQLMQIPQSALQRKFDYLCEYYSMSTNSEKLKELLRDVVDKEYLDGITDPKTYTWLAKCMGLSTNFKKGEEIKSMTYGAFSVEP